MSKLHMPMPNGRGGTSQSGMGKEYRSNISQTMGVTVQGVVMQVYASDDPNRFIGQSASVAQFNTAPEQQRDSVGIVCDVYVFSAHLPQPQQLLMRVPMSYAAAGMQSRDLSRPRAVSKAIANKILSSDLIDFPLAEIDGDFCLVDWIDGQITRPYISGFLDHPAAGQGTVGRAPERRPMTTQADGNNALRLHHGTVFGADKDGNFVVDCTRAYDGETDSKGRPPGFASEVGTFSESEYASDGSKGNFQIKLRADQSFDVQILEDPTQPDTTSVTRIQLIRGNLKISLSGGESIEVSGNSSSTVLQVGDGARRVPIFEELKTYIDTVFATRDAAFLAHVHPVSGAVPSTPPVPPVAGPPVIPLPSVAIPDSVASPNVKIP